MVCTFGVARPAGVWLLPARAAYAPLLRLGGGEPYRPLRIEDYLAEILTCGGSPPRGPLLPPPPTLFSLPTASGELLFGCRRRQTLLSSVALPPTGAELPSMRPRPTVYWRLVATGGSAGSRWSIGSSTCTTTSPTNTRPTGKESLSFSTAVTVQGGLFSTPRSPLVSLVRRSANGAVPVSTSPGARTRTTRSWWVRPHRLLGHSTAAIHTDPKERFGDSTGDSLGPSTYDLKSLAELPRAETGGPETTFRRWPDPGQDHRPAPPLDYSNPVAVLGGSRPDGETRARSRGGAGNVCRPPAPM